MPEGHRRLAAIMFTDMVGFSALAQRDEPLALKHVDEQRALLRPILLHHGGREVKTLGDGALIEFDSALDATECAVEMQRRLFERNRDAGSSRLEMRIGIHVGDVVHSEQDVYGDAVNIASRVEPLADPGGVCVTGPVHEQVQNKIANPFKLLERATLKNIETPVSVYRLELPWTPPSLTEAAPFVDRGPQLELLQHALAALAAGQGTTIAITGESGIGKSRLIEEFVARAHQLGFRVLRARGDRTGVSAPLAAWSEIVRDFAREAPNPLLYKACSDCAPEVIQFVPELKSRLSPSDDSTASAEPGQLRLFAGILRFLDNLGKETPLVIVLDDFQWADSGSVHLLEYVAQRLESRRVLQLVAYRDEYGSEGPDLVAVVASLERQHRLRSIALKRFDSLISEQMVLQMLRGRIPATAANLTGLLFEKSGGNPMILESIVRTLVGEGSLVWTEQGWVPKGGVDIRLPPGVQSVVRRRLDQLEGSTVDALRQASVFGPQFSFDALLRVTGLPPEELLGSLEEALRAHILEERPVGSGRSAYAFSDSPTLETLYGEISLVRRIRYHSNAARVLEALAAEGAGISAAELAHHYLRANEYEKALEYTLRAAEDAERLYAREEALRQYAVAQELLEVRPDARRRAGVLVKVGGQLDLLGRHSEAYRSFREGAEAYELLGMAVAAGEAHRTIARRLSAYNEPVRALEHLEKARRFLESGPPSAELARLYETMGMIMFQEVRMAEASESFLRAIAIARQLGEDRVDASARMMLACMVPLAEKAKVWEYLDEALISATKAGARTFVSNVGMLKAAAMVNLRGDVRGALRIAEDIIDYARKGRDVHFEMMVKGNLVTYTEWRLGDLGRAERAGLEHRAFAGGDPRRERPTTITVLAEVALARGDLATAEKLLWEAERLLAEGGDWTESAQTKIALARCALRRGKSPSGVEQLEAALALCKKAGPPAMDAILQLEALALLVRAHLDSGKKAEAATAQRQLSELASTLGEDLGHAFRSRGEGWVLDDQGDPAAAIVSLEASVALWSKLGWLYERAQTELSLAAVLRNSGNLERAAVLADQAAEHLSKAGAQANLGAGGLLAKSPNP